MAEKRKYGIGRQWFPDFKENGCVYAGSRDLMPHAYWDLLDKTIPFEQFLDSVRKWYAGMPYDVTDRNQNGRSSESHQACLNGRVATDEDEVNEQFYQALFYALLIGIGADVHAERLRVGELCSGMDRTSDGRIDISLKMADAIYILEFKYAKTSQEAIRQTLAKDYAVKFASDERPVFAVGLNVSDDRRTIDSYDIVQVVK